MGSNERILKEENIMEYQVEYTGLVSLACQGSLQPV
jgi:hypothetical protein